MIAAVFDSQAGAWIATVGILFGIVSMAGLVAGQFRKGIVSELRDSLVTANTELDIERKRGDRLEEAVRELEHRIGSLETENRVLTQTLQTGLRLAPEFGDLIKESFQVHEAKSEKLISDAFRIQDAKLARFEERVTRRTRALMSVLIDGLPPERNAAVTKALADLAEDSETR